jgi:hypothetical protein
MSVERGSAVRGQPREFLTQRCVGFANNTASRGDATPREPVVQLCFNTATFSI